MKQTNIETNIKTINLGLIKGRHQLPVDDYILDEIPSSLLKKDFLVDLKRLVRDKVLEKKLVLKEHPIVNLYLTGLSIVQWLVVDYLLKLPEVNSVRLFFYDSDSGSYYCGLVFFNKDYGVVFND